MATATKPVEEKVVVQEPVYDPWAEMVPVFLPKVTGEEDFRYVGINGRMFQVPRGKQTLVPRPVFDVLAYSQDAREYTDRFDRKNESVEREGL